MRAKDSKKSTISLLIIIAVVIVVMFIINVICKYNFLTVNNWMLIIAGAVIPTFTAWGLCFLFAANVTDFSIGAMVTLRQLEEHAGLAAYTHGAVKEALRHIVGVQLRNLATVGGSIYSRFGFSDVLTLFMAMDCSVELYKGGIVSLREYAERPYDRDILVRLIVKKEEAEFFYQSVRNSQTDIPVLTCAAARLENGSYRIAIGARPLKAVLFELPAKAGVSAQELAQNFADEVKQKIVTGSNMRGNAEYRRHLAGVLTKRAVLELEARTAQEEN